MRLMQHKKEAFWFYRFLSIFYDDYVNPLFWTEEMREKALDLVHWEGENLQVIDVGSGTGFTTQGIVQRVPAEQVSCVDQSPHQMAKAKAKADLQACHFQIGDAENIPFPTDHFDRYVSAGSIEYWPNPDQGIEEAYRVIKPGGVALMIGPLEPGTWFSRTMANLWMLFPKEQEYRKWFEEAGFTDIQSVYVRPHWHDGKTSQYGIAIAGTKPQAGVSPRVAQRAASQGEVLTLGRRLQMIWRVVIGSLAGFIFIPLALLANLRNAVLGRDSKPLTRQQTTALVLILALLILLIWLIVR